jgi:hypothetical protein
MNPDPANSAAYQAGCRQYLERGKQLTGDEVVRRKYSREELRAFVCGFETMRVAAGRDGLTRLGSQRLRLTLLVQERARQGDAK